MPPTGRAVPTWNPAWYWESNLAEQQRNFSNRNTGMTYRAKARRDPARDVAYQALRRVEEDNAYANLVLPALIAHNHLNKRDAAFATELTYGTLRWQGRYDAIIDLLADRPVTQVKPRLVTILRLGIHQLLGMRVEDYAAVDSTVDLARDRVSQGPAKFVNAVLRRVARHDLDYWLNAISDSLSGNAALARVFSYPEWQVWAFQDALVAAGRSPQDLAQLLYAQNQHAYVTLCARPGLTTPAEVADKAEEFLDCQTRFGTLSPYAVMISGGDPGRLRLVENGLAGVEDEGSQLVALLLAAAQVSGPERTWVDLCAGPGGKTALLAGLAASRGVSVIANEVSSHRAELVKDSVKAFNPDLVTVLTGDGVDFGKRYAGRADRVLVDAPCSGLGSLRRRPESRWRKSPQDLQELNPLQRSLLESGIAALRVGGVIGYATCSPHLAETRAIVDALRADHPQLEVIDAVELAGGLPGASAHDFGTGPYLQLWPDRDDTDAMFLALLRKTA